MEHDSNHSRQARKRPRECTFCGKIFNRSDILHRHYKRCSSRGTAPIPQPLKRGKRKRACDACAKSKLSCDSDSPCETCLMNGLICTYLRIEQQAAPTDQSPTNRSTVPNSSTISDLYRWSAVGEINQAILVAVAQIPRGSWASTDQKRTLRTSYGHRQNTKPFLLNYIDPKVQSVTDVFGYTAGPSPEDPQIQDATSADAAERLSLSLAYHPVILRSMPFDVNEVSNLLQPASSDDQQLLEYFFSSQNVSENQSSHESNIEEDQSWSTDLHVSSWNVKNGLTDDLMYHLHKFCTDLPAGHPERSPNRNLTQGLELISPSNITKFVNLYFHHWNRHSPIIHRATFDPGRASSPLLFAIILTGALFSSQDDAAKARGLLNLAEEFAFRNKTFEKLLAGSAPKGHDEDQLSRDALQAAISVAQVQLREGSASARRHARSICFGQAITAARTAGLMSARNNFFTPAVQSVGKPEQFEWHEFCHLEARIRLICGLFALDTSFMIFYNMTPRISVEELNIDMPCSLESYSANDAEACHHAAAAQLESHLPQMSDVLALYFQHEPESHINLDKQFFSVLDFYLVILALIRKVWALSVHEARMPEEPTRRALSQWKADWDAHAATMTPQQSELSGFIKQAVIEFWHLANIIRTQPA